ncbi:GMC family oxidoreductase [Actinokineospora enzanensis]|uniref:GMC family oxidoreductase n=1 Tax=Actinokineospora enzanensis TaxID=155975 RepID=UPI00037BAA9F|nr:GMC family oxidoreductase [Actinokineospora enzanensis]
MTHDVIVVGAGAAGCLVANRLAADPGRTVLLIEAGAYFPSRADWPVDLIDGYGIPRGPDWEYAAAGLPLPRGKVVGGSTSVNYCVALRSRPADHRAWADPGLPRWSWDEVAPVYAAIEDRDGTEPGHVPVRSSGRDGLTDSQQRFLEAAESEGFSFAADLNAPDAMGVGLTPLNQVDGIRYNAALVYLAEAARHPNLEILADTEVAGLVIRNRRVVGVRLDYGEEIHAGEVILCAGAYGSPVVLLRSGIGPADHLRDVGVEVVADVPGVGSNLREHPATMAVFAAKPEEKNGPAAPLRTMITLRSTPAEPDIDLHIHAVATGPTAEPDGHVTGHDFRMTVGLVAPRSVGSVRLRTPDGTPLIDPGFLGHPADAPRLAAGLKVVRRLAARSPLADVLVAERDTGSGIGTYHHPVGTCRMGRDRDAVVDELCRVHEIEGLSVIDASVMPVSPRATTTLPVLMLAEHAMRLRAERM